LIESNMADPRQEARFRAELTFQKQKHETKAGEKAREERRAADKGADDKTARLRGLRLAKEAAEKA
jgi:hypothetical protein